MPRPTGLLLAGLLLAGVLAPRGLGIRLRQVLLNLLSNASKFTENGTITLSASREP